MARSHNLLRAVACLAASAAVPFWAFAAGPLFEPLSVEIGPDTPLFIFRVSPNTGDVAEHCLTMWETLPDTLRPYSAVCLNSTLISAGGSTGPGDAPGPDTKTDPLVLVLRALQDAHVPIVLALQVDTSGEIPEPEEVQSWFNTHTGIVGVYIAGMRFDDYGGADSDGRFGPAPRVVWLSRVIDLAARNGRFAAIELDGLNWARVMSNTTCQGLYEVIHSCHAHVLPIMAFRGAHSVVGISSLMGLWLEGAVDHWGIAPSSQWYADAGFVEPGTFCAPGTQPPSQMPPSLYRAMILDGVMTGASVYVFNDDKDLWANAEGRYWQEAIAPALQEVLDKGLIPRREFVEDKVHVAYQLAPSRTALDFHLNLRDIDGVLEHGLFMHGAYGMELPGQVPELIPDSGRHYWVPIVSAHASQDAVAGFEYVGAPGTLGSAEAWTELLDRYYRPDGLGTAFIARVGRGIYVMNTRENRYEEQTFRIPDAPAPMRGIEASRAASGDGATGTSAGPPGVLLRWPFRDGDVAYKVLRRVLPAKEYVVLADDLDERRYVDTNVEPGQTVAYTVTALTNERGLFEGTVNYGDYLAFSVVESRVAEEVVIGPMLGYGKSQPIIEPSDPRPAMQTWWPSPVPVAQTSTLPWPEYPGAAEEQLPVAKTIAERVVQWGQAFASEDLDGVMDLYSSDYADPEDWGQQYARRAYQWFFERYGACKMHRQMRAWDFSGFDARGQVRVLLFCRFWGVAVTDATGHRADVTAYFPRTGAGEVWLTFVQQDSAWRIVHSEPALPNFKDILSFSAGPYDAFALGPDAAAK